MNDDWDDSDLEEAAPEDGDAARPVEVHQLEDVGAALGDHGHSQQEQHDTQAYCELSADRPAGLEWKYFYKLVSR